MTQLAANLVLLDRVLAHYGPEAADARASLRASAAHLPEVLEPGAGLRKAEFVLDRIQELSPKDDNQRTMKAQASNLAVQMGQARWYQPHGGLIQVSDAPLRAAMVQLGQ